MINQIYNTVLEFFQGEGWSFSEEAERLTLSFPFQTDTGQWMCYAQTREKSNQLVVYSLCPLSIPATKLPQVAEFITRANFGLTFGNFEMNYQDGEVRFKTSVDLGEDQLSLSVTRQVVYANLILMDKYLPGIMKVLYSDTPPADVIAGIEA